MIFLEFLKMEKKFCAYMRVSTTDQTVESQDRILKQYFEANGIKNPEFFIDHGISGTKANRPALDRMMAMVEADQVSTIVVYSFSRFARSTTHLLNALQVFKKKGVQFVSLTERIDTSSAVGLALFSILALIFFILLALSLFILITLVPGLELSEDKKEAFFGLMNKND
jgi:DNA invertase Pin-like site-specific DNA recombinase